ncbi:hypothetical protein ALNOE001_19350 [Candidatus Methanobinarius endosymbioticus]|uniref:Uncharacterized protein n=1 Tax=Candidatus Methanobinarius endosymbioticus TaxID=2006182 RepID=A0A366MA52_9EURY|nr:hypothetical protein ALNOE001_19350 [Candidatus Methanobinarius endosymbioticus]
MVIVARLCGIHVLKIAGDRNIVTGKTNQVKYLIRKFVYMVIKIKLRKIRIRKYGLF